MQAEGPGGIWDRSAIVGAIQCAAEATGADFRYMLTTAVRESGLVPTAKAGTSSATGLFQFIDQSWLGAVKQFGAKHGLGSFADAIVRSGSGRYTTADPADKAAILALRTNPHVAALMEGEFAQSIRSTLTQSLGRDVCNGEIYAAHFLGPGPACKLIRMAENQPAASAASAFPVEAAANRSIFYHGDGTAKTVREVYDWTLKRQNDPVSLPRGPAPAVAKPPQPMGTAVVKSGSDQQAIDALLADIASWNPARGFFASDSGDESGSGFPAAPFLLTPNVVEALQVAVKRK